jgi:membrane dipeptidase
VIAALGAEEWARGLGISRAAVDLYLESDVIDLHLDTFIWQRIFGYDPRRRHARPPLGGWFLGHVDFPRAREAALSGATWIVTTNPLREPVDRFETLLANLARLRATIADFSDDFALVTSLSEYRQARARGLHAAFIGIQGGNALEVADSVERLPDAAVLRVTLVHLSSSALGVTSSPLRLGPDLGLSALGRDLVRRLEAARILVDLAHISPQGFWDAVDVHDRERPLVVTHTGVSGVHRHWRNLDDNQVRAVAESGGVVGVMFHSSFLGDRPWSGRAERIVDHLEHVLDVGGEDTPALGSDFDGAIVPPRDLSSVLELPRLVELMLARRFSEAQIRKILGQNFLRVLGRIRP